MNKKLLNKKLCMDGLDLLDQIGEEEIDACIFDPQYRGILDKMSYGNEGEKKQVARAQLQQMSETTIVAFLTEIRRVLKPSSYLFLWVDKFIVAEGSHKEWFIAIEGLLNKKPVMNLVDMICWDKESFGNGYRSRRTNEYLLVYQKSPKTTKNWKDHSIPDTWREKIPNPKSRELHPHRKPMMLTKRLIEAVTSPDDIVLDPCAGSFITLDVCQFNDRNFIGCDIEEKFCQ